MYDRYNRKIDYLRIAVTDRCNMRCNYCMPDNKSIQWLNHEDILSYEEIRDITKYLVSQGITKVRLTGGEPLVRKDIATLVSMLSDIKGIEDLSMTTNGTLLSNYAADLKAAGLHRVNISLDTLNPQIFQAISSTGKLEDVMKGIDAAMGVGLFPIKLNCVDSIYNREQDIKEVKAYGASKGIQVRIIHQMNLAGGIFTTVDGGKGGNCQACNRLRISSDGKLIPCLFSDLAYDIRQMGIAKALNNAIEHKPKHGLANHRGKFNQLGG
ncbi:MAG: radical SAM protein [Bacteroidales bacterium]